MSKLANPHYEIDMVALDEVCENKQGKDILWMRGQVHGFEMVFSAGVSYLSQARMLNLSQRLGTFLLDAKKYLSLYIQSYRIMAIVFICLLGLAIGLSLMISSTLMKERIRHLRHILPLPEHIKKDKHTIQHLISQKISNAAILNVDIVNFSALVERYHRHPEFLNEILSKFYHNFISATHGNGGSIGKIMGDGIISIFGWDELHHEDHSPMQNIIAAMRVSATMLETPLVMDKEQICFRLGLSMGEITIKRYGNSYRRDLLAIGDAMELSEVLQRCATPNSIYTTAEVAKLMRIALKDEKELSFKGKKLRIGKL